MLYTSILNFQQSHKKNFEKKKKNHTKIDNKPISDTKHKSCTLGKFVFLKKKIKDLENPN